MSPSGVEHRAEWAKRPERSNMLMLRVMSWISLTLGRSLSRGVLVGISLYFLLFSPRARVASRSYLQRALGRSPRLSEQFRHFHSFASCIHDRVYLLNDRYGLFDIEVCGEALLREQLARTGGLLLFGAHLGSFEVTRAVGRRAALPVVMATHTRNARKINAALEAISAAAPAIVPLGDNPLALLDVQRLLEQGMSVGILADRTPREQHTEIVEFLGAPAHFPSSPFRAAAALGRPVVLMAGLYLGANRYRVVFEPLADFSGLPRAARAAAVRAAIERYAHTLERLCRAHPFNWFNFYDFWADR